MNNFNITARRSGKSYLNFFLSIMALKENKKILFLGKTKSIFFNQAYYKKIIVWGIKKYNDFKTKE